MDRRSMIDILQIGDIDAGNEMLFPERVEVNSDHLTIVIGCGGIGAAVIKKAAKKLAPGFDRCVKFLFVDADRYEIESVVRELGSEAVQTINISVPGADARFLDDHRENFYRAFMPKDFNSMNLDPHGSGRIRMNGKAKFYDHAWGAHQYIDIEFRNKIAGMLDEECKRGRQVDIVVIAGTLRWNREWHF